MTKALTLHFEHTPLGMKVWFMDTHGVWHPLEIVRHENPALGPSDVEGAYVAALRGCRPDMAVEVRPYRVH